MTLPELVAVLTAGGSRDVPRQVQHAATICLAATQRGEAPPHDLVEYITRWHSRQQRQDRYGK